MYTYACMYATYLYAFVCMYARIHVQSLHTLDIIVECSKTDLCVYCVSKDRFYVYVVCPKTDLCVCCVSKDRFMCMLCVHRQIYVYVEYTHTTSCRYACAAQELHFLRGLHSLQGLRSLNEPIKHTYIHEMRIIHMHTKTECIFIYVHEFMHFVENTKAVHQSKHHARTYTCVHPYVLYVRTYMCIYMYYVYVHTCVCTYMCTYIQINADVTCNNYDSNNYDNYVCVQSYIFV